MAASDQVRHHRDTKKRCERYKRVIFWTEGPAVFLFESLESFAYRTRVDVFKVPPSEIFDLNEVSILL